MEKALLDFFNEAGTVHRGGVYEYKNRCNSLGKLLVDVNVQALTTGATLIPSFVQALDGTYSEYRTR